MTNHQKRFMATTALAMLALALMVPPAHAKPIGNLHPGTAALAGRTAPAAERPAIHLVGRGAVRVPGPVAAGTESDVDVSAATVLGLGSVLLVAGAGWIAVAATRSRPLAAS